MLFKSPLPDLDIPDGNLLSYLFPPGTTPSQKPVWINSTNPANNLSPDHVLSWTKRLAVGLEKLGIAEGETVLVYSPNHIFLPVSYLATVGSKRIFSAVNPIYTADEVAFQMTSSRAALVLVHPGLLSTCVAAAKQANISTDRILLFSDTECPMSDGIRDWRSIAASETESRSWTWDPLAGSKASQTTAVINFSSGTTGLPKGVCVSHKNVIANSMQTISSLAADIGLDAMKSQRWLGFLPMYHAYSQLFSITIACKLGVEIYIMPKFSFEEFLQYIEKYKISAIQTAPPIILMLAKRPETSKYDISSLKHAACAAAPLSSDLQNEVTSRFGIVVTQAWGMTEATCSCIITPGMREDLTGSVGHLVPNTEARLVDDDGKDVQNEGEPGEVWVRGPQVTNGYWMNESATRETIVDGWLKTGDIAITRGGKWWIVDRKKELIKVNGLQVSPAELEAVLLEHPDVADAAVVGVTIQDEELPRAYVTLKNASPSEATAETIRDFVAQKVAKHKRLTGGISFVDEVPKLASGKIVRKVVKTWAKRDAEAVQNKIKARF